MFCFTCGTFAVGKLRVCTSTRTDNPYPPVLGEWALLSLELCVYRVAT